MNISLVFNKYITSSFEFYLQSHKYQFIYKNDLPVDYRSPKRIPTRNLRVKALLIERMQIDKASLFWHYQWSGNRPRNLLHCRAFKTVRGLVTNFPSENMSRLKSPDNNILGSCGNCVRWHVQRGD